MAPVPKEATVDDGANSPIRLLTGWGRTSPSAGCLRAFDDVNTLAQVLSAGDSNVPAGNSLNPLIGRLRIDARRGVIARGLGRSYGDAAQCAGGLVIDTSGFDSIGLIDPSSGSVEVGGGTSLDALIRATLPLGWFIPVSPGTRQVSVGGAIAADVHGKNHHRDGSFCSYVTSLTLVTPVGIRTVSPESDPDLFWATAGGMGLTGVIIRATIRLNRVETAWIEVDTERFDELDDTMSAMETVDHSHRYSVAWVDCGRHRGRLGRSVLTSGNEASLNSLESKIAQ